MIKIILGLLLLILFSCEPRNRIIEEVKIIKIHTMADAKKSGQFSGTFPYTTFEITSNKIRFTKISSHIYGEVGDIFKLEGR